MNLLKGPLEIKAKPIWHNKISKVDTSIILSIDSDVKWPTLQSINKWFLYFSYMMVEEAKCDGGGGWVSEEISGTLEEAALEFKLVVVWLPVVTWFKRFPQRQ